MGYSESEYARWHAQQWMQQDTLQGYLQTADTYMLSEGFLAVREGPWAIPHVPSRYLLLRSDYHHLRSQLTTPKRQPTNIGSTDPPTNHGCPPPIAGAVEQPVLASTEPPA